MSGRRRPPAAAPDRSGALSPPVPHRDPMRPILVSGEGLQPQERERRRLELRRQWTGRLIALTPELRDPTDLDGPLAMNPRFNWPQWRASVPRSWDHGALRCHRWGLVLSDGTVLRVYKKEFLPRLQWAVESVTPLLRRHHIEVPLWCESQATVWTGCCHPLMTLNGEGIGNTILLSGREPDLRLVYNTIHEIGHCTPGPRSDLDPTVETLGHDEGFRRRFGTLLYEFLDEGKTLDEDQRLWLRSCAVYDDWGAPICPSLEPGWCWKQRRRLPCPRPQPVEGTPGMWVLPEPPSVL